MKDLLPALVPLLTAVLGAVLAYVFTMRAKRGESMTRFKEEKYAELLIKLQGFIGTTKSAQMKREFFEAQYQSWLYASDEVVDAMNCLVQLVIASRGTAPDPELGRRAIGAIVLAMRRDLLGGTKLSEDSFRYTDVLE